MGDAGAPAEAVPEMVLGSGRKMPQAVFDVSSTEEDARTPARAVQAEVALNSGHKMPLIGFGTASFPPLPTDTLTPIIVEAVKVGYRHFDTAAVYRSEEALGRAVAEALEQGLIKSRDEVFITSKLWCTHADRDLVLPALRETLGKLGLEYVDLYLVHWPVRLKKETKGYHITKDGLLDFDIRGTWEAMEECSKLGLAKSIGVSNFGPNKLSQILQLCSIPPAVNQVEMNVAWQQEKLRECCREKGIHVSAWSPLAANGALWGSMAVIHGESHPQKHCRSQRNNRGPGKQVALRWVYEQGASILVKSFNAKRMIENLKIFDWEMGLTEEEVEKIKQIPQSRSRGSSGYIFVNENGPGYKSVDELWE